MKFAVAVVVAVALLPLVAPYEPAAQDRDHPFAAPGAAHWLGTDEFGRDQFSRLLYGGRVSLFAGVFATALTLAAGLALGGLAGYFGGVMDEIIMRGAELFLSMPWLYLLLGVRAFLPLSLGPLHSFLLITAIIGLLGWARPARLVRGLVLSGRELPYVLAARGFGAGPWYLFRRHLLPLLWPVLRTQAVVLTPRYVLAEVSLSFLGLGVGEPIPSWGQQIATLRQLAALEAHPWAGLGPALILLTLFTLVHVPNRTKQV